MKESTVDRICFFFVGLVVGISMIILIYKIQDAPKIEEEPPQIVYNVYISIPEEVPEETAEITPQAKTIPRDEQPITEDFDIFSACGYTAEELSTAVASESHSGMQPYISSLLKAEETYGVNAFYLLCKFGLESGWGQHMSGENNIGGWTTYDGGFKDFASVDECIMHIAKCLSTTYKDAVGGRLEDVCKRYCPDRGYLETLMQIMQEREAVMKGV